MSKNLWEETISILNDNDKTWKDVMFVCGDAFTIPLSNFEELAKKTNYDNGFGRQIIASDLKVVGENFFLERREYDGSEWWEYKIMPSMPIKVVTIKSLTGDNPWSTLFEIKKGEK